MDIEKATLDEDRPFARRIDDVHRLQRKMHLGLAQCEHHLGCRALASKIDMQGDAVIGLCARHWSDARLDRFVARQKATRSRMHASR
jgi:hypothetical protein